MKICIASAHAPCERQRLWRELQWSFISENTGCDFEYYVIANGVDPGLFTKASGVAHISKKTSHSVCIEEIVKIFEASDADYCLLLDSDCWPIRRDWYKLLSENLSKRYTIAAPIRTENLDIFPHPCAVFFHQSSLDKVNFGFGRNMNLLGDRVNDVGGSLKMEQCYPLMKTNYVSPHPVYASIYGDIFYHHCAGSRGAGVRCSKYYRHMITLPQQRKIYGNVTQQLRKNPKRFIDALRGVQSRVPNLAVKI